MDLGKIDAEMKKGIDARTKEFREKLTKLTYEKIKAKLKPSTHPLKGYPHNESMLEEAYTMNESVGKAVNGLNDLGNKMKGRDQKDIRRIEKLYRSGNKKVFQGAIRALDTDLRDQVKDIFDALGMVKQGVIESVDLDESSEAWVLVQNRKIIKKFKTKPSNSAFTSSDNQTLMTVSKAAKMGIKESVDLTEGKMKEFHDMVKKGMTAEQISKKIGIDVKAIKDFMKDMDESTLDEFGSRGMSAAQKDNLRRSIKNKQKGKKEERLSVSDMTERAMTLKQIAQKYKGDIAKAQKSGNSNSLKKAEKELLGWAAQHNEISGKDSTEADDWLSNVVADKDQFAALLKFAKD